MKKKSLSVLILIIVLVMIIGKGVSTYNRLVAKDEAVNHQWSQVENVLKRRADLIPNLVNTVKGYAKHESEVLTEITKARAAVNTANGPQEQEKANNELNKALGNINVVVEAYPELKADKNFQDLQAEIAGTENRIAVERKRYNDQVSEFNKDVRRFPTSMFASILGFPAKDYFQISQADAEVPEVSF